MDSMLYVVHVANVDAIYKMQNVFNTGLQKKKKKRLHVISAPPRPSIAKQQRLVLLFDSPSLQKCDVSRSSGIVALSFQDREDNDDMDDGIKVMDVYVFA